MAHNDLNQLLNVLLPFAEQMLLKRGEFFPFGSCMRQTGKIVAHAAYTGDERPPSQSLIDLMTQAFRRQADDRQIRAAGICHDVRTIPPGQAEKCDAVCASSEHQSGEAVDVFLPYKKDPIGGVVYGQIFAIPRTPQFFVQLRGTG
jgi:hypothetical protein